MRGWGIKDPAGRLLDFMPAPNKTEAWYEALEALHRRQAGEPGCEYGQIVVGDPLRHYRNCTRRLRALGYRVVRVELKEVAP